MDEYAPLWSKSHFSFLEGASHAEELVEEAHRIGIRSIALTDRDGVYGMVRAHVKAKELGVHLVCGAQMTVAPPGSRLVESPVPVGLHHAEGRGPGWANLVRRITSGRRRCDKGESLVGWDEVCDRSGGLVALWHDALADELDPSPALAGQLREAFGDRLFAVLARHRRADDVPREARLRARAAAFEIPLVAAPEILYHSRARRPLQDVLTCIRH